MEEKLGERNKSDKIILLSLFLIFFITFSSIGIKLGNIGAFKKSDLIFGADTTKTINDLTKSNRWHERSHVHPLFVLFLYLPSQILLKLLGSQITTSVIINALFGSFSPVLFYLILRKIGLRKDHGFLFAILMGLTPAYLVWGSVPDAHSFAAAALLLLMTIHLYAKDNKQFIWQYIPATLFAFGITITNIIFSLMILTKRWYSPNKKLWIGKMFVFLIVILLLGMLFITIQNKIFWNSRSQFSYPDAILKEMKNIEYDVITNPLSRIEGGFPLFFILYNIIPPDITVSYRESYSNIPHIKFDKPPEINAWIVASMIFYAAFLFLSIYIIWRKRLYKNHIFLIFLTYFIYEIILHSIYAADWPFLYSTYYTFALLAMIAFPFKEGVLSEKWKKYSYPALIMLITIVSLNSIRLIQSIISVYV
ncbi:MAG: hypothetical protein QGH47_07480 [Candidatus Woesearchaeota archaeon]|jgi:hypothetical protein|nr:hypothetical protein [Candidatus Woesearchaeota archaeon]